ncbi:hypothetical protein BDV95DRAFT_500620 [Massariosphaeria phaeospora]|uniref:HSF-type DNA-binding domain-containing protein n=1 Tax=Massariosphaeria phaeospora TaxID=100035 RepID=A0A7C8M506_9PLEO|nr:hypothetical protein BDV95DRAFT_500620 [Massariosphaeria phaeospora]
MASRKRRAPGTSPQAQQSSGIQDSVFSPDAGNLAAADQYMANWNDSSATGDIGTTFGDPPLFDGVSFQGNMANTSNQTMHNRIVSLDGLEGGETTNTGQLVRRNPNQQLAARGHNPWDAFNTPPPVQSGWENADDDEELEQKAKVAKKDAQSKRKQIPPFIQKLSSFLDEKNNTNLIRWSDDGNSFIVIDEDEFARTLIPELFKHNNYASFVRQLNMYGFHKKVGLSDNSMKASETKAKAPSEYFNKYFKRGRPELLWLIQKPKNAPTGPKRKRDDDSKQGDSDEERKYVPDGGSGGGFIEDVAVRGNQEMAMIPRTEYNNLRGEVQAIQNQQKAISAILTQIRRQNEQLYQQATAFQTLHDRHENSINAILTFLATFYNRSLEGNSTVNFADMFGPAMPAQQSHGNVVDVGEYPEKPLNKSPQLHRTNGRRPLALLPAPAQKDGVSPSDRAATLSPDIRSTASPLPKSNGRQAVFKSPMPQSKSPEWLRQIRESMGPTKFDNDSPAQTPLSMPENDEIMSAIHNVNANSQSTSQTPQFDFPAALSNYQTQGGNVPLTPQQRNEMLSLMANNASAASPNNLLAQSSNNAMVNPQPPPVLNVEQFTATQAKLDALQRMTEQQNSRVQALQSRLEPLSPSGSIPGLVENSYFGNTDLGEPGAYDLDLDSFVQPDDFFPSGQHGGANTGDITLPDLNYQLPETELNGAGFDDGGADGFNFDGSSDRLNIADGERRVESVSSSATSPAATVEEVEDESRAKRSPKRRKR